jgi:hypothetical protein
MAFYSYPSPTFQQAMRVISNITNAFPAVVTTTIPHQYQDGMIVRLLVPNSFGMWQVNKMIGQITIIDTVTFSILLDTTAFNPFVVPTRKTRNFAQSIPVGEITSILSAATRNVLPYSAT